MTKTAVFQKDGFQVLDSHLQPTLKFSNKDHTYLEHCVMEYVIEELCKARIIFIQCLVCCNSMYSKTIRNLIN